MSLSFTSPEGLSLWSDLDWAGRCKEGTNTEGCFHGFMSPDTHRSLGADVLSLLELTCFCGAELGWCYNPSQEIHTLDAVIVPILVYVISLCRW